MKKILLSLAAVGTIAAAAAPAAAQPWDGPGDRGGRYDAAPDARGDDRLNTAYVDRLDWRITRSARDGRISWGEARELRGELREVRGLAWRNETGRIGRWEYRRLADTVRRVEMRTSRYAANDGPRYGYGYGERYDWRR